MFTKLVFVLALVVTAAIGATVGHFYSAQQAEARAAHEAFVGAPLEQGPVQIVPGRTKLPW